AGIAGASGPPAEFVDIDNSGPSGTTLSGLTVASVTYGTGQPAGWLGTPGLSATIAPAVLTLAASTASLPAGTYTAAVVISSNLAGVAPQTVTVTLTVDVPPSIAIACPLPGWSIVVGTAPPGPMSCSVV